MMNFMTHVPMAAGYGMNAVVLFFMITLYALCIAYLGFRGWKKTASGKDYLLAGGQVHPFVMAMSYGAAFISTSALVGFGGIAGQFGMGLMWLVFMNIVFGILIAFLVFGRRTRAIGQNLNASTFPELIGKRFRSSGLKILIALVIFLFIPLYSSVVLISGSRFLQEVMEIRYSWALVIFVTVVAIYVIFGGLRGVMYVDALMGSIMVLGMVSLLVMCYVKLGGVVQAHQTLTDMAPLAEKLLPKEYALGHRGWTCMPEWGSVWSWTLISSLMLGVGIGALSQPQLAVRFMTVKSSRELNRAVLIGSCFILATAGCAYMTGALSNVFFYNLEKGLGTGTSQLAIQAAGGNPDLIIPMFIRRALPPAILYVFSLTMLSAAISTMSSLFHVTGSSIGHDLCRGISGMRRDSLLANRIGVAFGILVSVIFAMVLPQGFVARGTSIFFGVAAAAFLPTFLATLYWKRATKAGVWASVCTGVISSLIGLLFLHAKESAALGICDALFDKPYLIAKYPIPYVDPFVYSLPLSAVVLVVVSLCSSRQDDAHIERCFNEVGSDNKK